MAVRSIQKLILPLTGLSCLAAFTLFALPANAQNLITNGTFDTAADPWWGHAAEGAEHTLEVVDGKLCSVMTAGGENPWDVIIGYSGLALTANQHYRISLSATADADRQIRVKTGLGDAPYTDYILHRLDVGAAGPLVFDSTYLNLRDDATAQIQFQVGGSVGTVCVDDIVVEPVEAPVVPAYQTPSLTGHKLRDYSGLVKIGTAVDTPIWLSNPTHNAIVASEFSAITPANAMKMNIIQPTQGVFDFVDADALYAWATENGMEFRGHPLVWHTQTPAWLTDTEFTRDEMIDIMYAHIDALVGRYVGKFPYWDVVNEAVESEDGAWGFRSTVWHDRIGDDFMDLAFHRARAADPDAILLYNDYNSSVAGSGKADYVFEMIKAMRERGVPVDAVGLQNHWYIEADGNLEGMPDVAKIRETMAKYESIGVEVHVTEFDIRIGVPLSAEKEQHQTKLFGDVLQACIDAPNCSHLTVWGLSDIDSWVPSTFPEMDFAHLFDRNFTAKAGYHAMTDVLAQYPADGEMAHSDGGSSKKGCSYAPLPTGGPWHWSAFALLGLALWRRGAARHIVGAGRLS